jgi:AmmeMemoRadiSam system protein A
MSTDVLTRGQLLAALARGAIASRLALPVEPLLELPDWLRAPGAVFVTLHLGGALRGCIGSLAARRPLLDDLLSNATSAAFGDPRFPPLSRPELAQVTVAVSELGPLDPLTEESEEQARAALRPRQAGVVLEHGGHRGTFLPQVWAQIPEPAEFLRQLKRKAGLAPDFWSAEMRLSRYAVAEHTESPRRPALTPMHRRWSGVD